MSKSLPKEMEFSELKGCFIAGGAILSTVTKTPINDYDIYPKNREGFENAVFHFLDDHDGIVINITDRAITIKLNDMKNDDGERYIVQIITDFYETADDIFESFDYTVCMGAYDCDTNKFIFHEDFFPDIASKTLRFNPKTKYPMASLFRVNKYKNKGFFISKVETMKLALAIIEYGLPESWNDVENSIGGFYGKSISLETNDIPFSKEALFELLESMIFDFDHYTISNADNYSDVKSHHIVEMFKEESVNLFIAENIRGGIKIIDSENYHLISSLDVNTFEKLGIQWNDVPDDYELTGWKLLKKIDGKFVSGIYSKKVEYPEHEFVECNTSPYLFVFPTVEQAKNRIPSRVEKNEYFIAKVKFKLSDLKEIKYSRELIVNKLFVDSIEEYNNV